MVGSRLWWDASNGGWAPMGAGKSLILRWGDVRPQLERELPKRSAPISRGYKNQYVSLLASLKTSEPKSIAELRAFLPEKRQILGISEPSSLLMLEIDQTLQAGARSEVSL